MRTIEWAPLHTTVKAQSYKDASKLQSIVAEAGFGDGLSQEGLAARSIRYCVVLLSLENCVWCV